MSTPTLETGALVERARGGDERAWAGLVERFAPLVLAICHRHRLSDADAKDVAQSVWLALLEHLDAIREPAALPGWIATTTRRECLHAVTGKSARSRNELLGDDVTAEHADRAETVDDLVLRAERHAAFLLAFEELPPQGKELLILLMHDPPLPYSEIAARLMIAVGSIGPTRGRLLGKIRRHPAVAALLEPSSSVSWTMTHRTQGS